MTHPPEVTVEPVRRSLWERASVVWLVPLTALIIALGVAYQHFASRGPQIEVFFEEAQGIHAGETELRYRDVTVGLVEDVGFADGLGQVSVKIRLDKEIAEYVDGDAIFWVVKPEVTAQGVSGLDTVLSGVFIEGVWNAVPDGLVTAHEGQTEAPLLRPGEQGRKIVLRALPGAGLTDSTPVLYKGIQVGRIGPPDLTPGGGSATAEAVIFAPYDQLITSATRFWDVSGISFSLGTGGVQLDFSSVATLIAGGVAFDTLASGGVPVNNQQEFDVYQNSNDARESLFSDSSQPGVNVTMIFEDNVSGLTVGAPVQFGGLTVGEVVSLTGIMDPLRFRDRRVRLMVNAELRPGQIGLGDEATQDDVLSFLDGRVRMGLRAQLTTASILTGGLKIELVETEEAGADALDYTGEPFPLLPTMAADVADAAATAEGVLQRINGLPVEELLQSAIGFLESATALTANPELAAVPGEVRALVGDMRGIVSAEEMQALPAQVGMLMSELQLTMVDLRGIAAALQEAQAVERLVAAVEAVGNAALAVSGGVDDIPALIASWTAVGEKAAALPLEDLIAQASGVVASAGGLLSDEATVALPAEVTAAVEQLRLVLTDVRGVTSGLQEAQAVERLVAAVEAVGTAATAVSGSVVDVPALITSLTGVSEMAAALPLDQLVAQASAVVNSTDALLRDQGMQDLPEQLGAALQELGAVLADLRDGGTVENLNQTLGSARGAAEAIEQAADQLPQITRRLDQVLAQAQETLSTLAPNSNLDRAAQGALSEVERAARAVESLAKALERRPNSLILGR